MLVYSSTFVQSFTKECSIAMSNAGNWLENILIQLLIKIIRITIRNYTKKNQGR
jgi:hypothetical protein